MTERPPMTESMTALEYVRTMPLTHIVHQQEVNKQLWLNWNRADHARALTTLLPWESDEEITSSGVEIANGRGPYPVNEREPRSLDGPPPRLALSCSASMKHYEWVQKSCMAARIGEIFFVYNGTPKWENPSFYISYATQRVDTPRRWKHYRVRHLPSESYADVIHSYLEHMQ